MGLFDKLERIFSKKEAEGEPRELSLREGTPEFHYFVARSALESNDNLVHGMSHLAELLTFDPGRREWLDLLDRYLERSDGNEESLLPETEERYFATEAVRALVWARAGRLEDAVSRWLAVVRVKPDVPYLETWVLSSLEPEGALESLSPKLALHLFSQVLTSSPEIHYATAKRRRTSARFAALAKRFPEQMPHSDGVDMAVAGIHRKAGLFEEGLAYVTEAQAARKGSSWHLSVAEGLIYREMGETEAAEAAFQKALSFDSEDLTARLEVGDMYFRTEDWARANTWYESVLAAEPEHAWAYPSSLWCLWRSVSKAEFPDERFPKELSELARAGNGRARSLLTPFYAYSGYLPEPRDATANTLRQMLESFESKRPAPGGNDGPSEIKLTLSDVEAPSNSIAVELALAALGVEAKLLVTYENVATPDPRDPVDEIRYRLWKRAADAETLVAAFPPPPKDVVSRIAELAEQPYDRQRNWARASVVAEALGAARVEDVLACIVHPPPPPDGRAALSWIPRVQLAASDVLAQIDDGWEGSIRRDALYSLLLGPRDWSTESAILALTHLVSEYPVIAGDVHEAFTKLRDARPSSGYIAYEHALISCWLDLPNLFPDERKDLEAELKRIEDAWE